MSQAVQHANVMIIGSGPAGYTAAIYSARAMLQPTLIAGFEPGGQLMITTEIENFPGFAAPIQGPWLMGQMREQAKHVGTNFVEDQITRVDLGQRPFVLHGDSGAVYTCNALIIATGAKAQWLGLPSEEMFKGFGVSACATCDGFFFRNKRVAVIGGGNSAVEEALYLANIAEHVTLIHRRDTLRAERVLVERLLKHPKITPLWHHVVEEISGQQTPFRAVTHLRLKNTVDGTSTELPMDGVFVAIGHKPASDLFINQIEMKEGGYIKVFPGTTRTNIAGVFAAGDVADDVYRQAVTAAGLGCMAALEAERFLSHPK